MMIHGCSRSLLTWRQELCPQMEVKLGNLQCLANSMCYWKVCFIMWRGTKPLRVIPPECDRRQFLDEVHGGAFSGHLRDAKIDGELSKTYWWPKMQSDIIQWCWACLLCASRQVGQVVCPPLTPIPVACPFDHVGVDVLHFPKSAAGNQYTVVFVNYTKWPEVFATPDQSALTIAKLLVENMVCQHGVPAQLLSDRGAVFLSQLM